MGAEGEETEHGGAAVDRVGVETGVGGEQAGEEAAVAVTENQGGAAVGELGEEVIPTASERGAEGEVFEPAVGAGDEVKVGGGLFGFHRRKGSKRMGVSKARSAAARRWVRVRRRRLRSRSEKRGGGERAGGGDGIWWGEER